MGEAPAATRRETGWTEYVRRVALRDEDALAALYDRSSKLVYTIAVRILQDEADAAEVVMDVYRQVWESAIGFDERRGSAAAWLVTLTRSRAMDRRRSRRARTRLESTLPKALEIVASGPSPEKMAAANQTSRSVLEALAELPREQREVLELAFFSGLTHPEVAQELGEPLGTVKTRIRLGVSKLRDRLKDSI